MDYLSKYTNLLNLKVDELNLKNYVSIFSLTISNFVYLERSNPVADPGFPRGGGANPKGGAPTYYLANFSRKLHENEEIWGQRGARPSRLPP